MFCIKSDVITLESIEMYGFVTAWTSMDEGLNGVILLKYGSHEMRHTGFRKFTVVSGTPGSGCHKMSINLNMFCPIVLYRVMSNIDSQLAVTIELHMTIPLYSQII